ncbi:MAG: L-lactate permease [Saprospiraceae bacterium]
MEIYFLLGSLLVLMFCGLALRKLWLGALLGMLLYMGFQWLVQADARSVAAPFLSGLVITIELTLLLFGAYFFYQMLQSRRHFDSLNQITAAFSSRLAVAIVLCFFLGSFMEGIAGFGLPAMLIAPMLMALGFRPLTCILMPLAANTVSVTFGALGTALRIGLGIHEPNDTTHYVVLLNLAPIMLLPWGLAALYAQSEQTPFNLRQNWKMLLSAGAAYAALYGIISVFTTEYGVIVAGVGGLLIFVLLNVPRDRQPPLSLWLKTFYPYIAFVALLLIARRMLAGHYWQMDPQVRPLSWYQPGAVFVLTGLLYGLFLVKPALRIRDFGHLSRSTARMIAKATLTIFLLVSYAQIIRSDLSALAPDYLQGQSDFARLLICPLLGIFGSFLSGSATMSNIIFGGAVQALSSERLALLVALLHTGAAVGNAISLQNILMVKSVVSGHGTDYAQILKRNILIVGAYWLVAVALGYALMGPNQ